MNPLLVGGILDIGSKVIDKLFPDPQQKIQAQIELMKLQQEGAFKELDATVEMSKAQAEINKVEAG
ncbi:MAG: 3TM-type holin, partial [Candidatus Nanopelagicaceae bacterium]